MSGATFFTRLGRIAILLATAALIAAWAAQFAGGELLGLSQQHFFSDATVLALLGIAFLLDAVIHRREAAQV